MSPALNQLYKDLHDFFSGGLLTHNPVVPHGAQHVPGAGAGMSLFEYMTAGRPEIRAQQALYPYLRQRDPGTRREYHFSGTFIDFWLPNIVPGGVAIELKHYSPHQTGQFATLLGSPAKLRFSLASDLAKPRPAGSTLIQIALYTSVEGLPGRLQQTSAEPKFVKSYVRRPVAQHVYEPAARQQLAAWPLLKYYVTPAGQAGANDFIVPVRHSYGLPAAQISGRVCFFMGIVQPGHTAFSSTAVKGFPVCPPAGMHEADADATPAL
jgi:hypothetical protein